MLVIRNAYGLLAIWHEQGDAEEFRAGAVIVHGAQPGRKVAPASNTGQGWAGAG